MGQVLHGCATTTEAVRRAIQYSQESLRALASRYGVARGCTFDLSADDVPICPVEIRAGGEIWVKPVFGRADAVEHWRQRLADALAHNLSLATAKTVHGLLAAGQPAPLWCGRPRCSASVTATAMAPA